MPHANQYSPTAGFSDDANRNTPGRSGVDATALDDEFSHISESINQIINNQKLLQRDDGRLKDTVVEVHTLSREVLMLLGNYRLRGAWVALTQYTIGDVTINNGLMYVCAIAHVSDSLFMEQPNWRQFGFAGSADAAQAAAQAISAASNAAMSATSAQNAAGTSTIKAAEASASATSATNSAATAQTSASTASSSAAQAVSANNAAQSAAAAAQAAAQMGGVSNERIVYGDDASKTSLVAQADLAASSGFYESSDDTPTTGKWLITTIKSKTGNERVQYAYKADDPKVQYTRGITGAVKTPWLVSWNSGNFNPNEKANLTGGQFSGGVSFASEGAAHDPYGLVAVSKPAVADTPAYYSLTREGVSSYQIGISANNHLTFGKGTAGYNGRINDHLMLLEGGGNLWLKAYGWLHDAYANTKAAITGLVHINAPSGNVALRVKGDGLGWGTPFEVEGGGGDMNGTGAKVSYHKPGVVRWSAGIPTGNDSGDCFEFRYGISAGVNNGTRMVLMSTGGHVWAAAYGWLHDRFVSRVTNDVGALAFARLNVNGSTPNGGNVLGSQLLVAGVAVGGAIATGGALPGTWQCLGITTGNGQATLFIRIA